MWQSSISIIYEDIGFSQNRLEWLLLQMTLAQRHFALFQARHLTKLDSLMSSRMFFNIPSAKASLKSKSEPKMAFPRIALS
jgi:hypothetical protein